jgi:hypothetical protein
MDLDGSKRVCGICVNWKGKREFIEGVVRVKSSARGQCAILKKVKAPQGGCDQWQKWEGPDKIEGP